MSEKPSANKAFIWDEEFAVEFASRLDRRFTSLNKRTDDLLEAMKLATTTMESLRDWIKDLQNRIEELEGT